MADERTGEHNQDAHTEHLDLGRDLGVDVRDGGAVLASAVAVAAVVEVEVLGVASQDHARRPSR